MTEMEHDVSWDGRQAGWGILRETATYSALTSHSCVPDLGGLGSHDSLKTKQNKFLHQGSLSVSLS